MQTPEEFEWSLYQLMDHQMDDWKDRDEVHALIRARDAEWTKQFQAEVWARYGIEDRWETIEKDNDNE